MKIKKSKIETLLRGIQKNIFLRDHTTFKIGGPAKYFFIAKTKRDLISAIKAAKKLKLPFFILGRGSNLLVSDKGYPGLIINFQFSPAFLEKGGVQKNKIVVGAGTRLAKLVSFGLEWAAGIPGTVGGAVFGNAGAFGKLMEDVVESVEVFNAKTEKIEIFRNKDCQFGYRQSIFKKKKNLIVLSVKIKSRKSDWKKIKEYLNYRRQRHPRLPSAGSIFKNFQFSPQLLTKRFPELTQFRESGDIPAAFLISECGLKGKKVGDAQISEKHSNFIVNLGNARAKDVIKLINLAKKRVKERFGIEMEEEIQYLGFKNQNF